MLKIAKARTNVHKRLADNFLSLAKSGATVAALELLIRQSFQRSRINPGFITCCHRNTRFHLDRRAALYDWLKSQEEEASKLHIFHVSVMTWGDTFLYSYQQAGDSRVVYRLEDMLSDLAWYHSAATVPYYSAPNFSVGTG